MVNLLINYTIAYQLTNIKFEVNAFQSPRFSRQSRIFHFSSPHPFPLLMQAHYNLFKSRLIVETIIK